MVIFIESDTTFIEKDSQCLKIRKNRRILIQNESTDQDTLGQKPTLHPKIPQNFRFQKCEFCEKYNSKGMNFVMKKCEF